MTTKKLASIKKAPRKPSIKKPRSVNDAVTKTGANSGKAFEDQVADLYRLLGARVIQNIEIHQKKVDILATFRIPGSSRTHSVIVECKDEAREVAANQRIMAFKGLLDVARTSGKADSAEIITRVSWSDQAKGFAKDSGVELFTYTEKVSQLIDLSSYLKALISKFDKQDPARPSEPPLASYYVDLSAQQGVGDRAIQFSVIDTYVYEWLNREDTKQQLAIFGEYGSGKSTLCQKLARDLAVSYLVGSGSTRIPILLNLRDFIGKLDLEAYITSFLDRECNVVNPRIELFRAMNEMGIFLLIFDGFDEMAVKVDADTLEFNLLEIEKLGTARNSKLMLTSRPEYFINAREEGEVLTPTVNPFATRTTRYEPLKILPWNEDQIELFLHKRVPLIEGVTRSWTYYRDQIKDIGSLSDLSQRPVLLDMIVKTLPRLISSGEPINLPNLYKAYLIGEMKRQKILKKRRLLISDEARFALLKELAGQLYRLPSQSITFADASKLVEITLAPPKQDLESYTRDFLTNSFLVRQGDEYRLSHKSILEFLVAMNISEEIGSDHPVLFHLPMNYEILGFVEEFEPNCATLLKWIQATKELDMRDSRLGANAAKLMVRISPEALAGKQLSGVNLTGAQIWHVDLRQADLRDALLRDCELNSGKFYRADIEAAVLRRTELSFHIIRPEGTEDYHLNQIMELVSEHLRNLGLKFQRIRFFSEDSFQPDLFWQVSIPVSSLSEVDAIRQSLSASLQTPIAVFWDEVEALSRGFKEDR